MMHISESILWRGRVNGEVPTLPVGFEADDADHDMTPFLRRCITNRANVFQRWVLLTSAVTLNPAIRGHFKTGHRDWPET